MLTAATGDVLVAKARTKTEISGLLEFYENGNCRIFWSKKNVNKIK